MYKIISLLLVLLICFSLVSCRNAIETNSNAGLSNDFNFSDTTLESNNTEQNTKLTTEQSAVLSNLYGNYYIGAYKSIVLNEDNSVIPLVVADEDDGVSLSPDRSVCDGKTIYALDAPDKNIFYKYTFKDDNTLEKDVWVTEDILRSSDTLRSIKLYDLRNWHIDGEFIYFSYLTYSHNNPFNELSYSIIRINKEGTVIERIGDEVASSLVVNDGWIYYYCNGYTYDEKKENKYYIDLDKTGLYKIKTDGSGKQLLLSGFEINENDPRTEITFCDKINIFGEYVYFIDYSKNGKSRVCRMKTDGTDLKYLSKKGVHNYTVNNQENMLYYSEGEFGLADEDARPFHEVNINSGAEQKFNVDNDSGTTSCDFSYYNNYLYFINKGTFGLSHLKENPGVCGMRYDLKNDKSEKLLGYFERATDKVDSGFIITEYDTPKYYWDNKEK